MEQFETVDFIYPITFNPKLTVTVKPGQTVHSDQVVAEGQLHHEESINVAKKLKVKDISEHLEVEVGDTIIVDQQIASRKKFRTLLEVHSPIAGIVSELTDTEVIIQVSDKQRQITTPVSGSIQDVSDGKISVVTKCLRLNGSQSYGTAGYANLYIPTINDDKDTRLNWLGHQAAGALLAISKPLTPAIWYKAATLNTNCIICTQMPTDFDKLVLSEDFDYPSVIVIGDESGMADPDVWKKLIKHADKRCFYIPSSNQVLIPKNA